MTIKEYNTKFLPAIDRAAGFIDKLELAVKHMDVDKNEVKRILEIYGWSEETKELILKTLDYYREHEGIEKLENNDNR